MHHLEGTRYKQLQFPRSCEQSHPKRLPETTIGEADLKGSVEHQAVFQDRTRVIRQINVADAVWVDQEPSPFARPCQILLEKAIECVLVVPASRLLLHEYFSNGKAAVIHQVLNAHAAFFEKVSGAGIVVANVDLVSEDLDQKIAEDSVRIKGSVLVQDQVGDFWQGFDLWVLELPKGPFSVDIPDEVI